ncbi:MAG: glycosyltransferase family 4 protein [Desulfoplanes sp.]
MNKHRVAIMLPRLSHYGGVEGFAWRLAKALTPYYNVDFICARQETDPPAGVKVICVGRPQLGKFFKIFWFAMGAEIARRKGRYDLTIGLGNTICQDILRLSGGPTRIFWKHSIQAYPSDGYAQTWKMIRRRLSPANMLVRAIERLQIHHSRQLIANSHQVRNWTLEAFPILDAKRIDIIYNKPDLTRFAPCNAPQKKRARTVLNIPSHATVISTAGTNFVLKGILQLIQTLLFLPDTTILLVAGGRRPKKYQTLASKLGVSDRVRFLGKVDEMTSLYQASDLFILLSFYDACSNAVLEALASGLPVISTRTNGSSYFLPPRQVIDAGENPKKIALTIQKVLEGDTSTAFTFPTDIPSGIEPYVDRIAAMLKQQTNP